MRRGRVRHRAARAVAARAGLTATRSERRARDLKFLAIGVGGHLHVRHAFSTRRRSCSAAIDAVAGMRAASSNALLVPLLAIGARRLPQPTCACSSRARSRSTPRRSSPSASICWSWRCGRATRSAQFGGAWGETARDVFLVGAFALLIVLITSGGDGRRAAARVRLHAFLSQQVRLPHRVAALRADAVRRRASRRAAHHASARWRRSSQRRADCCAARSTMPAGFVPAGGLAGRDRATSRSVTPLAGGRTAVESHARAPLDRRPARVRGAARSGTTASQLPAWLRRGRALAPRVAAASGSITLHRILRAVRAAAVRSSCHFEDRDLLKTVGQHVATQLAQHDADRQLARSRPVRGLQPPHRVRDARPQELRGAAARSWSPTRRSTATTRNSSTTRSTRSRNTSERMTRLIEQLQRRDDARRARAAGASSPSSVGRGGDALPGARAATVARARRSSIGVPVHGRPRAARRPSSNT